MSFSDDFDRANSATVGNGWTEMAPSLSSISSNKLLFIAGGEFQDNVCYAPVAGDFQNGTAIVDFTISDTGALPQIHVRFNPATKQSYVLYNAAGVLKLTHQDDGAITELDTQAAVLSAGVNYRLTFTISGNNKTGVLRNLDTASDIATVTDNVDSTYTASGSTGVSGHDTDDISYDNFSSTVEAVPTIALTDEFSNGSTLLASETGITAYVLDPSDGTLVATVSALTTDVSAILDDIVDGSLSSSTAYWLIVEFTGGEIAFVRNAST